MPDARFPVSVNRRSCLRPAADETKLPVAREKKTKDRGGGGAGRAVAILLAVLKFPQPEKKLIQEVHTICKLLAVNPATSAAGEDLFSTVRCLKTWLRSRMADERFSNLEVWNGHRNLFPVMRTVRETSVLRTTSKSSNLRKVYLTYWLY